MERTFGAYRLGEPLAMLPSGELIAAAHSARSETLALLLLDARLSGDHRFRGLVRLELARAGGLRQPGIARIVEIGEQSGALAVVYERPAESASLATRLEGAAPPEQDAALGLIRQLAAALDAAHGRRIVHGLLGPAAVLVGPDLTPAIVGLGLLAAVEEAGLRDAILAQRDGTDLAASAPEQAGGKLAVASADGYALAVLAERLLGGSIDAAGSVLQRQLSADPSQRYPSCAAFAAALAEQVAPSAAVTSSPATLPPTPMPSAPAASPAATPSPAPAWTPPGSTASPPPLVEPLPPEAPPPAPVPPSPAPVSPAATPASPTPGVDAPRPPAPSPAPGQLPGWLRDSLDPPRAPARPAAPPGVPAVVGTGPAQAGPTDQRSSWRGGPKTPPSITRRPPTPAMLACLREVERSDILTVAVLAIADRVPTLDRLVERHAPDGRIGPVPLGAAVAGITCLLLLLLNQPAAAAIFVVLVLGVYVMPLALKKLTAAEQPSLEAIRATGTVSVRSRQVGPRWDIFELDIGDGAPLSLPPSGYRRLASIGQPVTVERQGIHGPEYVTVAHELPNVTVTYLMPSRLLLDVRDADGAVVHRHPEYAGEPGDRVAIAPVADASSRPLRRPSNVERPYAVPTWKPTAYGHRMVQRMPALLAGELQAAYKSAAIKAGLVNGVPAAILIGSLISGDFGFIALVTAVGVFGVVGAGLLARAMNLWTAQHSDTIVRVAAQLRLRRVERSGSKGRRSYSHYLRLDDGKELKIQSDLYERLTRLGRQLGVDERPGFWEQLAPRDETVGASEVDGLTVTYEPSSDLLLEIVDAAGTTLYRDSAVSPRAIGTPPPVPDAA